MLDINDWLKQLGISFSGIIVWLADNWSALAALVIFGLQATYLVYKIRLTKKQCESADKEK